MSRHPAAWSAWCFNACYFYFSPTWELCVPFSFSMLLISSTTGSNYFALQVNEAVMAALEEKWDRMDRGEISDSPRLITPLHFERALAKIKPSVSEKVWSATPINHVGGVARAQPSILSKSHSLCIGTHTLFSPLMWRCSKEDTTNHYPRNMEPLENTIHLSMTPVTSEHEMEELSLRHTTIIFSKGGFVYHPKADRCSNNIFFRWNRDQNHAYSTFIYTDTDTKKMLFFFSFFFLFLFWCIIVESLVLRFH